jgi:hypothetical protein
VGNAEKSQKEPNLKLGDSLGSCFWLDGDTTVFSVADFLRVNKLRDAPQLRNAVIEEVREMFPDVRILEEEN